MSGVEFWHWLALGGGLLIIEAFAPGFVFLWLGISAGLVGGLLFAMPQLSWQIQLLAFAGLSVISVAGWLLLRRRHPPETDHPTLNRRGQQHVGRVCVLVEAIMDGRGRVRIGDGSWLVSGPDLPSGTRVRVTASDGAMLMVEPADKASGAGDIEPA